MSDLFESLGVANVFEIMSRPQSPIARAILKKGSKSGQPVGIILDKGIEQVAGGCEYGASGKAVRGGRSGANDRRVGSYVGRRSGATPCESKSAKQESKWA